MMRENLFAMCKFLTTISFSIAIYHEDTVMTDSDTSGVKSTASEPVSVISASTPQSPSQALHFPSLFNNSFCPSALFYTAPTLMSYGEG